VRLAGKSVVITGAGSGVGRASALRFASEGAKVVCADVQEDWLDETVKLVAEQGGTAVGSACDVTREADVRDAIGTAVEEFGRLDVMFNNAGVATPRPGMLFEDHSDDDWDRLFAINLRGVFYGMKHAVTTFKEQGGGGAIVNTGSVAGLVGWGGTVYGATKGGVVQLTRAVAIEVAPFDIRVNCICPAGMPTTNFIPTTDAFAERPSDLVDSVAASHPLGRIITPEDCAAAALFLASDDARNLTGVLLPVDGGYVAR
jgi:NAD(P)-dependent dehydrogenase (short-subunit alcohol dehydrogenase family)